MSKWTVLVAMLAIGLLIVMGCSGSGTNPINPDHETLTNPVVNTDQTEQHLWGYYDVYMNLETQEVNVVPNRDVTFQANVTTFVNNPPSNLQFNILATPTGTGYIDVDIEVGITHPFPGLTQYNGYDVRGIFIGNGHGQMLYDDDLMYGVHMTDQTMLDCVECAEPPCELPCEKLAGSPDGYTRWWNPTEFLVPGVLGYTPGRFATPGYTGTATLNPYKYFADGLEADGDLWDFLTGTEDDGLFSAGTTNRRNYYIRFPVPDPNVKFNYAILASWIDEATHPANTPEAVGCHVDAAPSLYYIDETTWGGAIVADISIFDWNYQPSTIYIESSVLNSVYEFTTGDMTPVGGGEHFSTYHVEIPADTVNGAGCDEAMWIIAEYGDYDYKYIGDSVPNNADDPLAAIFRECLYVSDEILAAPVLDGLYYYDLPTPGPPPFPPPPPPPVQVPPGPPPGNPPTIPAGKIVLTGENFSPVTNVEFRENGGSVVVPGNNIVIHNDNFLEVEVDFPVMIDSFFDVYIEVDFGPPAEFPNQIQIVDPGAMFHESFDSEPTDWYIARYDWYGSGYTDPDPAWTTEPPFYGTTPGNLRWPPTGTLAEGDSTLTIVTPPFDVPDTFGDVWLRVYACQGNHGDPNWWGSNLKITVSDTPGLDPFLPSGQLPGSGVEILEATTAHGATWPVYDYTPITFWSYTLAGQNCWGTAQGGGAFPAELDSFFDVTIPPTYYGQTVKVAFQLATDLHGYVDPPSGFALDEYTLMAE